MPIVDEQSCRHEILQLSQTSIMRHFAKTVNV